jgi:hypothetical protein
MLDIGNIENIFLLPFPHIDISEIPTAVNTSVFFKESTSYVVKHMS